MSSVDCDLHFIFLKLYSLVYIKAIMFAMMNDDDDDDDDAL